MDKNIATYNKLIESAKAGFFEKGFQDTSIREISSMAGLTIGSLYHYFESKEDLFQEVVKPVYKDFLNLSQAKKDSFIKSLEEDGVCSFRQRLMEVMDEFNTYIFENWELFSILVSNQETKIYQQFFQQIVANEVEVTMLIIKSTNHEYDEESLYKELELIITTQYSSIFRLISSKSNKKKTMKSLKLLFNFYQNGWNGLIDDKDC